VSHSIRHPSRLRTADQLITCLRYIHPTSCKLGCIVALALVAYAGFVLASEDAQYLLAGVAEGQNAVETLECKVIEERRNVLADSVSTNTYVYRYKRGRELIDRVESTAADPPWHTMAWDGKVAKALLREGGPEGGSFQGAVMPTMYELTEATPLGHWMRPVHCGIEALSDHYDVTVSGTALLGERQCWIVEAVSTGSAGDTSQAKKRLWVYPGQDGTYLIGRYENFKSDGTLWCRYDYTYGQQTGVHYPAKSVRSFYHGGELSSVYTSKLVQARINEPLSDLLLELDFPEGTRVLDHATGRFYTVGDMPDELTQLSDALIADLATNAAVSAPAETGLAGTDTQFDRDIEGQMQRFEGDTEESPRRGRTALLLTAAAGVGLAALLLFLLRKSQRHSR